MQLFSYYCRKRPGGEKCWRVSVGNGADKVIITLFAIAALALLVYTGAIPPDVFFWALGKVPALSR